jgi:hypothetical protein
MTYSREVKLDYIKKGIIKVDIEALKDKIEAQVDVCINGDLAIGQPLEVEAGISPDLLKLWDLEEELEIAQEAK